MHIKPLVTNQTMLMSTNNFQTMLIPNDNADIPDRGPPPPDDEPPDLNRRSFSFDNNLTTHFASDNMTYDDTTYEVTEVLDHITQQPYLIIGTPILSKGGMRTENGGLQFSFSDSQILKIQSSNVTISVFMVFSCSTYKPFRKFFKFGTDFEGDLRQQQNSLCGFGCSKASTVVDITFNGNRNSMIGGHGWFPVNHSIFEKYVLYLEYQQTENSTNPTNIDMLRRYEIIKVADNDRNIHYAPRNSSFDNLYNKRPWSRFPDSLLLGLDSHNGNEKNPNFSDCYIFELLTMDRLLTQAEKDEGYDKLINQWKIPIKDPNPT
jgi:hypothetical protein